MSRSNGASGPLFGERLTAKRSDDLKAICPADCFGSLVYGKTVAARTHAMREAIIHLGELGWNFGCIRDPAFRAERVGAAEARFGAVVASSNQRFHEILRDFAQRKEMLFPWLKSEISVRDIVSADCFVSMDVTSAARVHRVTLASSIPTEFLGRFCMALEEIATFTELQVPIMTRSIDLPFGFSDIDKTKFAGVYGCQAGNLAGYEQLVTDWSLDSLSVAECILLRGARGHIADATANTSRILGALLGRHGGRRFIDS